MAHFAFDISDLRHLVLRSLFGANSQLLYLPPYSPDFNPIEQVFAKLKALLRRAAPRSFDTIVVALRRILERFPPPSAPATSGTPATCRPDRVRL